MANTAMLRYKVEPVIRERLGKEFGQPFASRILALPGGARREFDAVSADGTVGLKEQGLVGQDHSFGRLQIWWS